MALAAGSPVTATLSRCFEPAPCVIPLSHGGDMFGQKSAAKTYGILEFVRDNGRVRIKLTGTLTHPKLVAWSLDVMVAHSSGSY
uniref:OSJNba0093F12.19 protein n=1 Tax=Oryza sativa subsp. japonica TaxID=39947 RepID=Q7XNT9_ORYSJ|nr:OSJNba0093F12.19 [Oryza sativa Japonica Group]